MIPPWMLAPAAKILGVVLVIAALWGWGYVTGRSHMKQAWDASIAEQATKSAQQIVAEAKMSSDVLKAHAETERKADAAAEVIEQEVIRYVQAPEKPCVVDPQFMRLFDQLSRLPDTADRVPATAAGAGKPAQSSEADLTTTEVLQAYHRAVEELTFLWIDYDALVQWERGRYIVQQAQQAASP